MTHRLRSAAGLFALAALVHGCSGDASGDGVPQAQSRQRHILSEGYSLLYVDAGHLRQAKLVLLVKFESAEFDELITRISDYGGELKADLERIARDYPGVRIDLEPLPEMEKRKRLAIGIDRAIDFAPLRGRSRREYERTLLIGLSNALNHESHLCGVMAAEEPDAGLRRFLLESERRYQGLHALAMGLLEREHFRAVSR